MKIGVLIIPNKCAIRAIENNSALVQEMAWPCINNKPLPELADPLHLHIYVPPGIYEERNHGSTYYSQAKYNQ